MDNDYEYSRSRRVKPSAVRRKADCKLIDDTLHKNDNSEYDASMNPFQVGELRHERFERLYKRERISNIEIEKRFNHLLEIYGAI